MSYVPMTDDELFSIVRNYSVDSVDALRAIERATVSRLSQAVQPNIQSQQYSDETYRNN
jgi:hypothetical protein